MPSQKTLIKPENQITGPLSFQCIRLFVMRKKHSDSPIPEYVAFTPGQIYQGEPAITPTGDQAIRFVNDAGLKHLLESEAVGAYFQLIDQGELL